MIFLIGFAWLLGVVVWGFPILSVAYYVLVLSDGGVVGILLMLTAIVAFDWMSQKTEDRTIFVIYTLVSLVACAFAFQWWALAWLVGFAIIHIGTAKLWW